MLTTKFLNSFRNSKRYMRVGQAFFNRYQSSNKSNDGKSNEENDPNLTSPNTATKYKVFKDEDSEVILDIYEERNKYAGPSDHLEEDEEEDSAYQGLNLEHGIRGVFDIEDLVEALKRENAADIFVAAVSKDIEYVDYICVVSGKSTKHMQAIAQFIRKVYKIKRNKNEEVPRLEGQNSADWMALDLGNIALHIFSKEARNVYDLDSLWSLGSRYDHEYNKQDPVAEMMEKYSVYLKDLKPAG